MSEFGENAIEWITGSQTMTVTLDGKRYVNRVKSLARSHPDEVEIVAVNDDGTICAHLPLRYLKLTAPAQREISDDQKAVLAERLKNAREKKQNSGREE